MNGQLTTQPDAGPAGARTVLLVTVLLIAGVGLLCVRFAGPAVSGHSGSGTSSSQSIIFALGLIAVVVLLRVAHYAEHRLRSHTSVARSYVGAESSGASTAPVFRGSGAWNTAGPRGLLFRRTYSPSARRLGSVLFAAAAVLFVVFAIGNYSKARRSEFVQNHGTSTLATVVSVTNRQYCGRSCHWTAAISVTLAHPVDGVSTTVVRYPHYSWLISRQRIAVLVDPKEPGYAELPGTPYKKMSTAIADLLAALVLLGLAARDGRAWLQLRSHYRDHFAPATATSGLISSST